MNLVLDAGNTRLKYGVFEGEKLLEEGGFLYADFTWDLLFAVEARYPIQCIAFASVVKANFFSDIPLKNNKIIPITHNSVFPFRNEYKAPQDVGIDRLIGLCGALAHHPFPILVIDLGTCITYDFVNNKGEFLGGAISLGYSSRLKAIHQFTANLPIVPSMIQPPLPAQSTVENIQSGTWHGIFAEISYIIERYKAEYPNLGIFISGGDAKLFVNELNYRIFAHENLVLQGLNRLIQLNAN